MRTQSQDQDGTRTVMGYVGGAGTASGAGFSSTRTAPGEYTVRFDRPFRATPAVTLGIGVAASGVGRVQSVTNAQMQVLCFNSTNTATQDTWFTFQARGFA